MLGLDYFKAANDAYGREADNFVLGHISSLIKKSVRRLDMPCRYEGEEFTISLPNTTLRQEIRFANRLRLIIENPLVKTSDALLGVEASFGVEVYVKGDELTEKAYVEKVAKNCHSTFEDEDKGGSVTKNFHAESTSSNVSQVLSLTPNPILFF